MKIIRQRRPDRFTVLDNQLIENADLSFRALGVLAYLLSRPDGWETDSTRLARNRPEGRDAVRTALKELERAGYLMRRHVQDNTTGRWSTVTEVLDSPETDSQASGIQASVSQSSDIQSSDSQALLESTDTEHGDLELPLKNQDQAPTAADASGVGATTGSAADHGIPLGRLAALSSRLIAVEHQTLDPAVVWFDMKADGIRHPDVWATKLDDVELAGWLYSHTLKAEAIA
ncbi:helix-turn-helix domain-containing protein [Nocardioides sp.]|uniref:helix-turn-helix domain-containing protein n=1 Tax=Nocardioides sp. TaxID=35761 RepID=UPI003783C498